MLENALLGEGFCDGKTETKNRFQKYLKNKNRIIKKRR